MTKRTRDLVKAALLLAFAVLLPTVFHLFKLGGPVFLPMHIPVLKAGFMVSWKYASIVGFAAPFISFLITAMPPMPGGIVMMFELAVYGGLSSILYRKFKLNGYLSLIVSMLAGRLISIAGNWLLAAVFMGKAFNFAKFTSGLFIVALPGIIIQLVFVPVIVKLIEKSQVKERKEYTIEQPERVF